MLFGQKSFVQKASGQSGEEVSLQMQQLRRQETGQIWFKKEKGQIRFLDFFPLKKLETKRNCSSGKNCIVRNIIDCIFDCAPEYTCLRATINMILLSY